MSRSVLLWLWRGKLKSPDELNRNLQFWVVKYHLWQLVIVAVHSRAPYKTKGVSCPFTWVVRKDQFNGCLAWQAWWIAGGISMDKASASSLFLLALDFQMVWCYYTSELKVSAAKLCLFEHNCSLALSAYFFGFYVFGKFLNEVSTNKIDFFIFVEGVYTLPCSICPSLSPVFLCPVGYSFSTSAFRILWKWAD